MKFGKTLEEIVQEDWKEYALNYRQMKKLLPKEIGEVTSTSMDQGDQFWSIYDRSKQVLATFYKEKEEWAEAEMKDLQNRVEAISNKLSSNDITNNRPASADTKNLDESIFYFLGEIDLLINFIRINQTGFSKILKKFDKRTISNIREDKLKQLAKTHSFLDCKELLSLKCRAKNIKSKMNPVASGNCNPMDQMTREETDIWRRSILFLENIEQGSPFFAKNRKRQQPTFEIEEIETGSVLGSGEYGIVKEIRKFNVTDHCPICFLNKDFFESPSQLICKPVTNSDDINTEQDDNDLEQEHEEEIEGDEANRGFMRHHCLGKVSRRYAIKRLKKNLTGTQRIDGSIDIAIEAKFLSTLSHPNIIKIRGVGGLSGHSDYFIVLDRLNDTLEERCNKWKKSAKKFEGFFGLNKKKDELQILFSERLIALFDICRAMRYLHKNNVIYRDLKPENIGFDVRDTALIFDFGLVKELQPKDKTGVDEYRLSGKTGTRRYMAPEVVLCKPYGKSADVYSFAILMWQVLALKEPYSGFDYEKHAKLVVKGKLRPKIKPSWPFLLIDILQEAWADEASRRPDFNRLCEIFSGELDSVGLSVSNRTVKLMDEGPW